MVDIPLSPQHQPSAKRTAALRRFNVGDARFRALTQSAALLVVLIFIGIIATLVVGAMPAIKAFGWGFLTSNSWNPVTEKFGAFPAIYGTLVTSALAMIIAVPVGIGVAIFLTELCPRQLRRPISIAIELLAGIPSIIYGIWGFFVFVPFFQASVEPWIISATANLPFLQDAFAGPPYGIGIFTAGFILSIMILPFISAVTRDVFATVPPILKEAAYGLGCTTWEVMWQIVLPYSRSGVVGGAMLALGRALGETMAVTFVVGNAHHINLSLLAPGTTISATIANEFAEALGDLYVPALIELGLILFFITFVVLATAQLLLRSLDQRSGGGVEMNRALYRRRRATNTMFLLLSVGAAVFGIAWLALILFSLITQGVGGLNIKVFTEITPAGGSNGGLANAIMGSVMMSSLAVVIGTPIGIFGGTYLAEYGRHGYRPFRALHQRHPSERTVDPDRPVRLR